MKKLIAVLLALSCMLIGAAAGAETLNIAYMPNYGSLWSVETAINKGYFEEEGLTINLVEFADGPTIIAAMESGSIDMGYIGQGAHKLCINGRASIFALSHISNGDALNGGKGITTVEAAEAERTGSSTIRMTHEQIAQHISSAREAVARMLKSFSEDGLVALRRGEIVLRNVDGLMKLQ